MSHAAESFLEGFQLLDTGSAPRVETAMLRDVLARSPARGPDLADINAYKHRLHALRCENSTLRLRIHDLETQLSLMRSTRGWRLLEKIRWWRRTVSGWFQPFSKTDKSEPRPRARLG